MDSAEKSYVTGECVLPNIELYKKKKKKKDFMLEEN